VTAYAAKKAHKVEKALGEKDTLRLLPAIVIVGILLLSLSLPYVGVLFYLFIALSSGFLAVVLDNYVNKHIEAGHRATMMSINNLFASLGIAVLFPVTGLFIGFFSLGVAYALLAGVVTLYLLGFFLLFSKKHF
ncbi:hypothetical protein GF367_00335, partial [Candidatus Woesearchaeota archaeon]|nr:hypothetical protein [Candidatus Woesearchaeota archaeon]